MLSQIVLPDVVLWHVTVDNSCYKLFEKLIMGLGLANSITVVFGHLRQLSKPMVR